MSITTPEQPDDAVENRITESPTELHVGLNIPVAAARAIHRWAMDQDWPEGTKLEQISDYHSTLMYTPDGYDAWKDAWWIEHIHQAHAKVVKVDSFSAGDKGFAYVLELDSPEIAEAAINMQTWAERHGLEITHFPGGYTPHITVGYGPVKAPQLEPPNIELDVGPSAVSPPRRDRVARAPEPPPNLRAATGAQHCGDCKMFSRGLCWGYGNYEVEKDEVCDSWAPEKTGHIAYAPEEAQTLNDLSLANIAHNLHYRFEQGSDASDIVDYAHRLLKLVGYPQDDITTQAAIQSWQQLYPQDRVLEAGPQAKQLNDYDISPEGSSQIFGATKTLAHLDQYAEMVPIDSIDHLREWDRTPGTPQSGASPEYWNALKQHVAKHGFENPLSLEYNPHTGKGYLGEGNHRLGVAKELGMSHVPLFVYRTTKDDERMKQMHEPGTYLMPNQYGHSQFGQYMKPSDIGMETAGAYQAPSSGQSWYDEGGERLGKTAQQLFHWVDSSDLDRWMDQSHTGPGATYLTKSGDDPKNSWNDDIPYMQNPVRLTIDTNQLDPNSFDDVYKDWNGNYLYKGIIPNSAIQDIQSFKAPKDWDNMNVMPGPDDDIPEWGGISNEDRHHDVQFSNDFSNHQGSIWAPSLPEPQSPEELAQGRACYFHPERPAVRAEGFAPMCESCSHNYEQTKLGNTEVGTEVHDGQGGERRLYSYVAAETDLDLNGPDAL